MSTSVVGFLCLLLLALVFGASGAAPVVAVVSIPTAAVGVPIETVTASAYPKQAADVLRQSIQQQSRNLSSSKQRMHPCPGPSGAHKSTCSRPGPDILAKPQRMFWKAVNAA
jgi:hypothetical protein